MRIIKQSLYYLVYGRLPKLPVDEARGYQTLMGRLLQIIDKVPQLRNKTKETICTAQEKLDKSFEEDRQKLFKKGDLVLYFDKAKANRFDAKLEPKWKGPYEICQVLDKGAYRLSIDGVAIKNTVNGNLLKPFYGRSTWEPIVIVDQ